MLAEYLGRLLADLDRPDELPAAPRAGGAVRTPLGRRDPRGQLRRGTDRIVLVAEELVAEDEEATWPASPITREQAAAFAVRATSLVEAGRPPCPLCGLPLDPTGHQCPRTNGHRPPPLTLLAEGEIEVVGRMPWSSNQTFLVTCHSGEEETGAVYKPERGERQLWDFPEGDLQAGDRRLRVVGDARLGSRPGDVERDDAPLGAGSLQRFVHADFSQHHFTLIEEPEHHERLRTICAFDVVANNADRKSGHCILGEDGTIWAIDNGLCFHGEPKLRTVIWEFAGEQVPEDLLEALARLPDSLPGPLRGLLSDEEIRALRRRARTLAESGTFPLPDHGRHPYPWPLV